MSQSDQKYEFYKQSKWSRVNRLHQPPPPKSPISSRSTKPITIIFLSSKREGKKK